MTDVVSAPSQAPSVADLQAEVAAAREELVASLSQLREQTQPKALIERSGRNVAGFFTDEFGGIRPDRVAMAAGVVVGIIALRLVFRRRG